MIFLQLTSYSTVSVYLPRGRRKIRDFSHCKKSLRWVIADLITTQLNVFTYILFKILLTSTYAIFWASAVEEKIMIAAKKSVAFLIILGIVKVFII